MSSVAQNGPLAAHPLSGGEENGRQAAVGRPHSDVMYCRIGNRPQPDSYLLHFVDELEPTRLVHQVLFVALLPEMAQLQ